MEERLNELEIRYMQQESVVQELNEIVCRQELTLAHLLRDFMLFKEQMLMVSPSVVGETIREEPPPHY